MGVVRYDALGIVGAIGDGQIRSRCARNATAIVLTPKVATEAALSVPDADVSRTIPNSAWRGATRFFSTVTAGSIWARETELDGQVVRVTEAWPHAIAAWSPLVTAAE